MARIPKPWWWKERKAYYAIVRGVKHRLSDDLKEANRLCHALQGQKPEPQPPKDDTPRLFTVVQRVLEWVKKNRSAATHDAYKQRCQWFIDDKGGNLAIEEITPELVDDWAKKPTWSDGMRWTVIGTLKTVFRRAKRLGIIPASPIQDLERPSHGQREHFITTEEHAQVMGLIRDESFRDLLTVAWECGPRPQEILRVCASHVDVKGSRWIFPVKESKGKKKMRVVNLTANSLSICRRLCKQHREGPIFRNADGEPWTPAAVNCCFVRLRNRMGRVAFREKKLAIDESDVKKLIPTLTQTKSVLGVERLKTKSELREEARMKLTNRLATKHAQKLCLYLYRHSWMTRMLLAGNDPITVAAMGGHSDPSTLAKIYQHVLSDTTHVQKALAKIQ